MSEKSSAEKQLSSNLGSSFKNKKQKGIIYQNTVTDDNEGIGDIPMTAEYLRLQELCSYMSEEKEIVERNLEESRHKTGVLEEQLAEKDE